MMLIVMWWWWCESSSCIIQRTVNGQQTDARGKRDYPDGRTTYELSSVQWLTVNVDQCAESFSGKFFNWIFHYVREHVRLAMMMRWLRNEPPFTYTDSSSTQHRMCVRRWPSIDWFIGGQFGSISIGNVLILYWRNHQHRRRLVVSAVVTTPTIKQRCYICGCSNQYW